MIYSDASSNVVVLAPVGLKNVFSAAEFFNPNIQVCQYGRTKNHVLCLVLILEADIGLPMTPIILAVLQFLALAQVKKSNTVRLSHHIPVTFLRTQKVIAPAWF
ncbi:hypothetical protein DFH29DRAFT_870084 [Suillus ampliporus]|nr:hypothetical protein DFH29DRAFT_870084 [Suillus ampliporus]